MVEIMKTKIDLTLFKLDWPLTNHFEMTICLKSFTLKHMYIYKVDEQVNINQKGM